MPNSTLTPTAPVTLEDLARAYAAQATELAELRERLEDIEDLQDLHAAIERNAGQPLIPWEQVRHELPDLTDEDFAEEAARHAAERDTADGR